MVFSSLVFLFCYFPIVLCIYFLLPFKALRNYWLLIASIAFYAYGEPQFVFVMLASVAINYVAALAIGALPHKGKLAKLIMGVDTLVNIGLLFVYKYLNFTVSSINSFAGFEVFGQTSIVLPIGISFFTFQALSYVIDVYRGDVKVQKNPLYVGMYIAFFPQLIAGPIVRYSTIESEIDNRKITLEDFSEGVRRFMIGFAKKILLANQLAVVADAAFAEAGRSVAFAWLGILCYSLQILYDFSGYSEMAIGMGRMFGFHFLENFDYPYISASVSEFWRRWHISLGTWFRDYVYFPLGGSRVKSKARLAFNLFVVWALTGIWHGANWTFLLWGLLFYVFIVAEKLAILPALKRCKGKLIPFAYRVITLLCVVLGWVLFRAANVREAVGYIGTMFGIGVSGMVDTNATFYAAEYGVWIAASLLCATPVFKVIRRKLADNAGMDLMTRFLSPVVYFALFVIGVSYLAMGAHNPFIYFNF